MSQRNENEFEMSEDRELAAVLQNFRATMHAWSEHEHERQLAHVKRLKAQRPARWFLAPALSWSAAAALAVAAVSVPMTVHHQHEVVLRQQADAQNRERKVQEAQEAQAEQARQVAASAIDDDGLLQHVDADVAQETPDAMQPLASLMRDSGTE